MGWLLDKYHCRISEMIVIYLCGCQYLRFASACSTKSILLPIENTVVFFALLCVLLLQIQHTQGTM
jgi:hypothetical protein